MTNSFAKTHYFFLLIELKKTRNGIFNTQSIPFGTSASLYAAIRGRAVDMVDLYLGLKQSLSNEISLIDTHIGQRRIILPALRTVLPTRERLGHVQILPHIVPELIETVGNPCAESEVHTLAMAHDVDLSVLGVRGIQ